MPASRPTIAPSLVARRRRRAGDADRSACRRCNAPPSCRIFGASRPSSTASRTSDALTRITGSAVPIGPSRRGHPGTRRSVRWPSRPRNGCRRPPLRCGSASAQPVLSHRPKGSAAGDRPRRDRSPDHDHRDPRRYLHPYHHRDRRCHRGRCRRLAHALAPQRRLDRPANVASGKPCHGVNTLALWIAAQARGYACGAWGTYRQYL